jgi:bile acid-coenzyme A ligase
MTDECVPVGDRLRQIAETYDAEVAVRTIWGIDNVREISWAELNRRSDDVAARLLEADIEARPATVLLMTRDAVDHAIGAYGAWKLGLSILPLTPSIGSVEGQQILKDLDRAIRIGESVDWASDEHIPLVDEPASDDSLERVRMLAGKHMVPDPMLIIASSGSTGVPKLIDVFGKGCFVPGQFLGGLGDVLKRNERRRSLVCSPLNHGAGSAGMYISLFDGGEVSSMAKFDPDVALWAIKEFQIATVGLVPTMMARMLESPRFDKEHLQSLTSMSHTGGICSPAIKMAWIETLGAEKITEIYGSTESVGHTVINGTDWLTHQGSQGKPVNCELMIQDPNGDPVPTGDVGEVFVKPLVESVDVEHKYMNPNIKMKTRGEWVSVGDLGYVDEDGFLYVVGRVDDLIITGGANVYPDEIEIVLRTMPGVDDCVVVPRPDADLGQRVHAVISLRPGTPEPSQDDFREYLRGRLTPYKVPRTFEVVPSIDRTEAGKVRRKRYANPTPSS